MSTWRNRNAFVAIEAGGVGTDDLATGQAQQAAAEHLALCLW